MLETIKHMLGFCGEPHGFLYNSYVYLTLFSTWFILLSRKFGWWIEDKFWR